MEWREQDGVRWLEARLAGATAAFTTRRGGVSESPFEALNLGIFTADDPDAVAENRRRLAAALGFPPERVAAARQVHGAELLRHADPPSPDRSLARDEGNDEQGDGELVEADGHAVLAEGIAALVFVADCVPVALSGPGGAAILHCGWRGLAAGVIAKGAAAVGATDAAIGPSIGPCCYEVGPEVLAALRSPTGAKFAPTADTAGGMADLPAVAQGQLRDAGVGRVEASGLCTSCRPELFFSHRRDGSRSGRQAGVVWRKAEGS